MRLLHALAATGLFAIAVSAQADDLIQLYGLTSPIGTNVEVSFTVPDPVIGVPGNPPYGSFTLSDVNVFVNGRLSPDYHFVTFFTAVDDGGLTITNDAEAFLLNQAGSALFTPTPEGPTFRPVETNLFSEDYKGTPEHPIAFYGDFSVFITPIPAASTPEPSSFALLGTGILGVARVLKRRCT